MLCYFNILVEITLKHCEVFQILVIYICSLFQKCLSSSKEQLISKQSLEFGDNDALVSA